MNKNSSSTLKTHAYHSQALIFALFLTWLGLVSSCGVQSESNPTRVSSTSTQGVEVQASIGSTPTSTKDLSLNEPIATSTRLVVASPSPTPTEVLTFEPPTIMATETVVPLQTPTLNAEQLRWQMIDSQIAAVMASNNGCRLPCWWGVEAGDSVIAARQIFSMINENGWVDSSEQRGELQWVGFFDHFYRNEVGEYIYAGFTIDLLTQEELINVIDVYVGRTTSFTPGSPEYNQIGEHLLRDWEQYSARNMFEVFGEPDLIYLLPKSFADGDNFFYEFNIYYPRLGIVASYSSRLLVNENGEQTMCLNMLDMDSVHLYLYDPAVELPNGYLQATYTLWPLATELEPEDMARVELSDVESRTGLSLNEFVGFILDNRSDDACFAVN